MGNSASFGHITEDSDGLLLVVENLGVAHDRQRSEHSDITSSQNSAGDDGENRDLNLPNTPAALGDLGLIEART
ncbi:hypothetical protein NORO109296_17110 [Nocardiopsis rhodophaea]|uniref:hypothetical protein n=1 Tax=Nocardiopsis rhodophaea TaxID=280238 RepID=UPI0031D14BE7